MIKQRSIPLCIIFTIITCGIYGIYWFVCLTNEVNMLSPEGGTSGGLAILFIIITCGIYSFYWAYKQGEKIDNAKLSRGWPAGNNGILYLILCIFGLSIFAYALMQNELNNLV